MNAAPPCSECGKYVCKCLITQPPDTKAPECPECGWPLTARGFCRTKGCAYASGSKPEPRRWREFCYVGQFISQQGNKYAILDPHPADDIKFWLVDARALAEAEALVDSMQEELNTGADKWKQIINSIGARATAALLRVGELEKELCTHQFNTWADMPRKPDKSPITVDDFSALTAENARLREALERAIKCLETVVAGNANTFANYLVHAQGEIGIAREALK